MNLLHMQYALEVANAGSFTKAAENLYIAQPNLSKGIKELEEALGYLIFDRSSKGVSPTSRGSEFLVYARNISIQVDKMEELGRESEDNMQNFNVSIPRGSYIAQGFVKFVQELDRSRGINVNMEETNSVKTIKNVAEGHFHLGVIRYQLIHENYFKDYLHSKGLDSEDLWEFMHVAIMSKHHPLAKQEIIEYSDLLSCIEIVHGDNSVPYLMRKESVKENPTALKQKIYVYERYNQFELLESIPTSYMWTSPIPDSILNRYGLLQRKCYHVERPYKDVLIFPKGYKWNELDRKFIEKVKVERDIVSKRV